MSAGPHRRYRIAIAGFLLESVTFIDELTTLDQFRVHESAGADVIERHRGANTPTGGFIEDLRKGECRAGADRAHVRWRRGSRDRRGL